MGAFRHSQTKVLLFRGLKMAVLGIRELHARLPLCLKERGCRTLAQETGGSLTAGEKNKKTQHLDGVEKNERAQDQMFETLLRLRAVGVFEVLSKFFFIIFPEILAAKRTRKNFAGYGLRYDSFFY